MRDGAKAYVKVDHRPQLVLMRDAAFVTLRHFSEIEFHL